jgi:hypothetical protein
MGLEAVVYKRFDHLPEQVRSLVRLVDPSTGDLEFRDDVQTSLSMRKGILAADGWGMNVSERKTWQRLPDVFVRLHKDQIGYPPKEWEQLKAEKTDSPDVFKIKSIPFYARGLAYDDEIATGTSPEGYEPVFVKVKRRSGFSTMRLFLSKEEDHDGIVQYFTKRGVLLEFNGDLVALAIPRDAFEQISDYVCDEKDKGRWDAEDGHLVIDDPPSEMQS